MNRRDLLKNIFIGGAAATGTIIQTTAQAQDPDWIKWVVNGCKKRFFRGFGGGPTDTFGTLPEKFGQIASLELLQEAREPIRFTACPRLSPHSERIIKEFQKPYPFSRMAYPNPLPTSHNVIRFNKTAKLTDLDGPDPLNQRQPFIVHQNVIDDFKRNKIAVPDGLYGTDKMPSIDNHDGPILGEKTPQGSQHEAIRDYKVEESFDLKWDVEWAGDKGSVVVNNDFAERCGWNNG